MAMLENCKDCTLCICCITFLVFFLTVYDEVIASRPETRVCGPQMYLNQKAHHLTQLLNSIAKLNVKVFLSFL